MNRDYPGYFITFEGGEGSGKSSNIWLVTDWLRNEYGLGVVSSREPGGTGIGEKIRDLVHDVDHAGRISFETEALLYQASRAQHVHELIRPALEEGKIVLVDRFIDSSSVYQGLGRGLGIPTIEWLNNFSTGGIIPDLTLFMDVDPVEGLRRRNLGSMEMNRMDLQPDDFHYTVRQAYNDFCAKDRFGRWCYIDANKRPDEVIAEVKNVIEGRLIGAGLIEGGIHRERG